LYKGNPPRNTNILLRLAKGVESERGTAVTKPCKSYTVNTVSYVVQSGEFGTTQIAAHYAICKHAPGTRSCWSRDARATISVVSKSPFKKCRLKNMKLILASASPRRAEILRNAGFLFEIQPAHVDETLLPNERAEDYVRRLAEVKANAVAARAQKSDEPAFIIGADTAVLVENQILGKPADAADARRMLHQLSGKTHQVLTGLAIITAPHGQRAFDIESTRVTFLPLSNNEIDGYLATGEPFDKAGAYGIQGIGGRFVSRIEGCYFNVMGLPVSKLWQMLRKLGWSEEMKKLM
jgi:septum formation protein